MPEKEKYYPYSQHINSPGRNLLANTGIVIHFKSNCIPEKKKKPKSKRKPKPKSTKSKAPDRWDFVE